jgi:RNA polymerase sigma-70 factor (ECF subfamily)
MSFLDTRELSDEELLKDSIEAPSRFELLMLRYQKEFLNRATAVVKNRDEAEDVVQETFVRIYRFAPKFDSANGTFRSWSLTILMNVARTKYQKVAKERGHAVVLEDEHYQSLKDPVDSHQDFVNKDEVKSVLSLVDAETAQLLTLAYIDDLPYREIAAMMDTTEGAVKARVHRARGALRDALAKRGV